VTSWTGLLGLTLLLQHHCGPSNSCPDPFGSLADPVQDPYGSLADMVLRRRTPLRAHFSERVVVKPKPAVSDTPRGSVPKALQR